MSRLHLMFLAAALACLAPTADACGQRPLPASCGVVELVGEWESADGQRLRFVDSRDRGFTLNAHRPSADGSAGPVVYRLVKALRDCKFHGWRSSTARGLHLVRFGLDPVTDELSETIGSASPRVYRRLPETSAPPR